MLMHAQLFSPPFNSKAVNEHLKIKNIRDLDNDTDPAVDASCGHLIVENSFERKIVSACLPESLSRAGKINKRI